jgi:hypothetical protein
MFKQDKKLIFGVLVAVGIFAAVHVIWVQRNWAEAARLLEVTKEQKEKWDKYYKPGDGMIPKPQALKALNESNNRLQQQLETLKGIEFGNVNSLHAFSESAAGTGDKKSYLLAQITKIQTKGKDANIGIPDSLGFSEKNREEPVALNLLRLAMVDRLLMACKESNVALVAGIRYETPRFIAWPFETAEPDQPESKKKSGKEPAPKTDGVQKLVQFPMRVTLSAPERALSQLLYELQRPTDDLRGYFCIRGFHVTVKSAESGRVDASIAVSALLNEKTVTEIGIQVKVQDDRRGPRDYDLERY